MGRSGTIRRVGLLFVGALFVVPLVALLDVLIDESGPADEPPPSSKTQGDG